MITNDEILEIMWILKWLKQVHENIQNARKLDIQTHILVDFINFIHLVSKKLNNKSEN
jgi:hypothetical protein